MYIFGSIDNLDVVHIQLSTETWKKINAQREPNQTIEEAILTILGERDRLKNMIRASAEMRT